VRTVSSPHDKFAAPWNLIVQGPHLWVVNANGDSVTELNTTTGSLVKVLSGHTYGFDNPIALAVVGQTIWIANGAGNSITVVSSSTGAFLRYLP
jgi:DNA-binding beta-propeller fold protein YncE